MMSRTPAALFLLADHREREALAEAARARSLSSIAPGSVLGARVTRRLRDAVALASAAIVAREPFGALRREVVLRRPIYRGGR
jgi:hypothetical protein